jgi:hypothetical protein
MDTVRFKGGCWPTREQELLLRAALLQGKAATDAWNAWKLTVDIAQIDQGSYRLLPLLYKNLRDHGIEDPWGDTLKGVYRSTWYKNQLLFHHMIHLLRSFHYAGIPTMILKGAALTVRYYHDVGLRPMNDFDILVHTDQAADAIDLLMGLGWRPKRKLLQVVSDNFISLWNAQGFRDNSGRECDLHWHVLKECCQEHADDDFWDGAISVTSHDVHTYALNSTDQLLHVCIHGLSWNPVPPLRWVADAMTIIKTSQAELDWDRLLKQVKKRRVILPLRDALHYVHDLLDAPIPLTVFKRIHHMAVSSIERMEYTVRTRYAWHPLTNWFRYVRYSQLEDGLSLQPQFIGLPRFLQHSWGLRHLWQVPLSIVVRAIRKLVEWVKMWGQSWIKRA